MSADPFPPRTRLAELEERVLDAQRHLLLGRAIHADDEAAFDACILDILATLTFALDQVDDIRAALPEEVISKTPETPRGDNGKGEKHAVSSQNGVISNSPGGALPSIGQKRRKYGVSEQKRGPRRAVAAAPGGRS